MTNTSKKKGQEAEAPAKAEARDPQPDADKSPQGLLAEKADLTLAYGIDFYPSRIASPLTFEVPGSFYGSELQIPLIGQYAGREQVPFSITAPISPSDDEVDLRKKVKRLTTRLDEERADKGKLQETVAELEESVRLIQFKNRLHPDAWKVLLHSKDLQQKLVADEDQEAFVISIDMRRSTDLMLKAKTPKLFAVFITSLCQEIAEIILRSGGVFDKFTGDGVLGYFPTCYSGEDAGYWALRAASDCHISFRRQYLQHRRCFSAIPSDAGLGIGIDFGVVNLVQIHGGPTVVGTPVVYACRMSAAPAGQTFLNHPALDKICGGSSAYFSASETTISVKNEGDFFAYTAQPSGEAYSAKPWAWLSYQANPSEPKS